MTQQTLITRLKAVEEALECSLEEFNGLPRSLGYEFTHKPKIEAAISDLRKLIKEAEGQQVKEVRFVAGFSWHGRPRYETTKYYTALGEKP